MLKNLIIYISVKYYNKGICLCFTMDYNNTDQCIKLLDNFL